MEAEKATSARQEFQRTDLEESMIQASRNRYAMMQTARNYDYPHICFILEGKRMI